MGEKNSWIHGISPIYVHNMIIANNQLLPKVPWISIDILHMVYYGSTFGYRLNGLWLKNPRILSGASTSMQWLQWTSPQLLEVLWCSEAVVVVVV